MSAITRADAAPDLEEFVDRFIHRPIAQMLVGYLVRTRVTPNQVTVLSGIVGVVAGALLIVGAGLPSWCAAAGVALLMSCILDCADGQLARARNMQSPLGMILDGLTDNFVGTSVFVGLAYNAVVYTGETWMWVLGVAAGLSAAAHVWVFDAKKKQYLECLGLAQPEEPISELRGRQKKARLEGRSSEAFLLGVYAFFRTAQSVGVSQAQASDTEAFWRANRGRMRLWTLMGSGTHFFLLYAAALLLVFWPGSLLACVLLYLVGLNLLYLGLLIVKWRII